MSAPPPARYRVIERDRRLIVIDTRAPGGAAPRPSEVTPAPRPAGKPPGARGAGWLPRRVRFDGAAELATRAFYDARGPRTVLLDPGAARAIEVARTAALPALGMLAVLAWFAPVILLPAGLLLNPGARARARTAITRWLDAQTPG